MNRSKTCALALASILVLSVGAQSAASQPGASPRPGESKTVIHHRMKAEHPIARPAKPMAAHSVQAHRAPIQTRPESSLRASQRTSTQRTQSHPAATRTSVTLHVMRKPVAAWSEVSQPVTTFAGRTQVVGRAVAMSRSHVIVSMPNGALRTFVAFRESSVDRDRFAFRVRGETRTFTVVKVSRPIAHRVVVFADHEAVERMPELTMLRVVEPAQDEVMMIGPNGVLEPFAVTAIEPLPFGQVALFANDQLPQTFVPAEVTFVGRPISIVGDLVTFLLPDGTTRTLVDTGPLPAVGSEVVVVENGQQVMSLSPAVTNFVGQVVAGESPFVTVALPDGSLRTLTTVQTVPAPGTRAVIFENGDRVARFQLI